MSEPQISSQATTGTVNYSLPRMSKRRLAAIVLFCFFTGLVGAFPFFFTIEKNLKNILAAIPGCAITFKNLEYEVFFPKLIMKDLSIPSKCLGIQDSEPVRVSEVNLYFRLISFAPFGPHFKLETELFKNPISAYLTFSLFNHAINIKDNNIDLAKLSPLIPNFDLKGTINLNTYMEFNSNKVNELQVVATSKNLTVPGQRIMGFTLFPLPLQNFLIKGQMNEKGKFNLESFIIGDTESPIRSNFKGTIDVNHKHPKLSKLHLKGEVFFSDEFLEKLAVVKMAMAQYTQKDKFYQLEITGQMAGPTVKSPTK